MAAKWNRSEYYSPYTSIVQSSGCGKTRTVLEFSRSNWVFFVCFRETGSTGYPYRSFIADYLSKGALDFIRWNTKDHSLATAPISECDLVKLFYMSSWIACIRELKAHLEQSDFDCHEDYFKSWIGQQMQVDNTTGLIGTVFWRSILERTVRVLRGVNSSDFDNFRQQLYEQMVVSYKKLDQTIDTIGLFENDKCPRPMALLALDEASELSNRQIDQEKMLQLFRNAFGVIVPDRTRKADTRPKTLSFAILTDTQTKLVNFHPKYLPDRSKRRRQPTKLFDPLWLISNWNVDLEIADVSTEQQLKEFALKCGRYLWRCYSDCDYEEVVNLAGEKLLCVAALEGEVICTRNQAMALLGCRLALNFHAFASFIPELCSSHMAACLHVFENTDRILGSYPSEPVLADASAMISQNHLQFKISILLKYLRNEIREGVVEAGYRGELVAKILLLLARDSAVIVSKGNAPVHSFVQMTSVYNYLVSLCGKANIDSNFEHLTEDDFGKRFLNGGVVYFTHFAYVTYTPSRETMGQFFNRGAAIFCKRNQVGIDLIIPVKMVDGEWSFILVTVKNYASKSNEATLAPFKSSAEKSKTDTGKAPFPYLVLFMDINPSQPSQVKMISAEMRKTRQQSSQAKKNFPVTIAVTGLSDTIYPFISMYQGLHEELKSLAVAWVEPISFQTDNAKRNDLIRMTLPAYSPYDSVTRKADADVFLNANESQIGDAIKIQTDEELPEVPQAKYIRLK